MEPEAACDRICEDISNALLDLRPLTKWAAFTAASATRNISDALHHAAGHPEDPRWSRAFTSLERFLDVCSTRNGSQSPAVHNLETFLAENLMESQQLPLPPVVAA